MHRYIHAPLLAATLSLCACGDADQSPATASSATGATAHNALASCLLAFKADPCQLLDDAVVQQLGTPGEAELERSASDYGDGECSVSWLGGRTRQIDLGGRTMESPQADMLSVGGFAVIDEDPELAAQRFAAQTRTRSDAERQQLGDQVVAGVKKTDSIDDKHQQMAQDFARDLASKINFTPVEGLGDAAAWGGLGRFKQLQVRVGHMKFHTSAQIADDDAANLAVARQLAEQVLDRCQ
ncbi:MAG: hypothetical protein Tsb002_37120 [Wenzhouxiangellaceae bacterium]